LLKGRIMDSRTDDLVVVALHMPPVALELLRRAADHAGMPFDIWLTTTLASGIRAEVGRGFRI
jgi:hypothetical protein